MTHRVPHILSLLVSVSLGLSGCDQEEPEASIPTFEARRTGDLVACEDGSFDREQINAVLADYPELAEELGMSEVQSCEDAGAYFDAYADYIESFPPEDEGASDVDLPAEAFRVAAADGANLSTGGVLELPGCTGVLIHSRALLTAAHCVDQWAPSGAKNFWKSNYTIKNFGGGTWNGTVRINIHPNYTGRHGFGLDTGDDIAVVKLTSGSFGFPSSHRHRLYTGQMSAIGWMQAFGRGATSNNGGAGVLRYMNYRTDWSGPHHFLMNATDASRICKGDSGGPVRDLTPTHGYPVVAGLNSSIEIKSRNDQCARSGGKQRAVRIQDKVRWIDDMIGGTNSDDCTQFTDSGWTYERCF